MSDFAKDKKENYPSYQQQLVQQAQADYNFAEDKAKNYPSTQPASTPVVADGQQATATTTTGQEQQPATTSVVAPQQPVSTTNANQPQEATTPDVQHPVTNSDIDAQVAKMNEVIDPVTGKPKEQPVQQPTVTPSKFGFGQDGVDLASVVKNPDQKAPVREILDDYFRWCRETGNPIDYFTVNDIIHDKDVSKSPADNEKERIRAERKERWDKVGNFLLHLGNVVGNVAGGGMGAIKLEDPVKFTERQRLLKEKTLERRNAYNQSILAQMSKQNSDLRKAEMEKRRQDRLDKETKIRQEKNDAYRQYQLSLASKNEAMTAYYQAKAEALEQGLPLEEALKRAKIAKEEAQARLANTKANAGGFAPPRPVQAKETTKTTEKVDSYGGKTTTTTTTHTGPAGKTDRQNTPPSRRSRRNTSSSSNTPPSRRRKS